jgi:RNA polymerase sigma-70 factor, ECF subfamily
MGVVGTSMSPADVAAFEAERGRLVAIAYRMLGTVTDAEDVVQDGWLRWDRLGADGRAAVANRAAWCTTAVTRLALDRLRAAKRQREEYVGPWLPEPVATTADPAETVELAESLTLGFLALLERLNPVERAAFLLADVFGEPYARIAEVLGRSEEACRQAASRARRRVRQARRGAPPANAELLLGAFLGACAQGDVDGLRALLAADVVLVSDGGALVHAARRPVVGADRVTRLLVNLAKRMPEGLAIEPVAINGEAGFVGRVGGAPVMVVNVEERAGLISAVRIMVNPDKLRAV